MLIEVKERLDGPEIVSRNAVASDVGTGCGRRELLPDGSGEEEVNGIRMVLGAGVG